MAYTIGDVPKNLMEFMIFLSAGFFLGNGIEHGASALASKGNKNMDNIHAQLDAIQKNSETVAANVEVTNAAISTIMTQYGIGKK